MIQLTITMKDKKLHIRLEPATYKVLAAEAKRLGLPASAYMRMILIERSNGLGKEKK